MKTHFAYFCNLYMGVRSRLDYKIVLILVVALTMVGVFATNSVIDLMRLRDGANAQASDAYQESLNADVELALVYATGHAASYVITHQSHYLKQAQAAVNKAHTAWNELRQSLSTATAKTGFEPTHDLFLHTQQQLLALVDRSVAQAATFDPSTDATTMGRVLNDIYAYEPQADELRLAMAAHQKLEYTEHIGRTHTLGKGALYGFGANVLILAGLITTLFYFTRRSIVSPINRLAAAATTVATGGLTRTVTVSRIDEIGRLEVAFNQMVVSLRLQRDAVTARTAEFDHANAKLMLEITAHQQAEAEILAVTERLSLALDSSQLALWDLDLTSNAVYLSDQWSIMLGQERHDTLTTLEALTALVHPDDVVAVRQTLTAALKSARPAYLAEHRVQAADGQWHWILSQGKVVQRDDSDRALRMIGTNADITERKEMDEALRGSEERFRLIAENVSDLIAMVDTKGRRVYNSPSYQALFGDMPLLPGSSSFEQIHLDDRAQVIQVFQETVTTGTGRQAQFRFLLPGGGIRFIESQGNVFRNPRGEVHGVVIVSRDITERLSADERLRHMAHHDLLTELPNRLLLQDRLEQAVLRSQRSHDKVAVVFIDLDNFKHINDSYGHALGDGLLREVATRLKSCVRNEDTVARQGGDEFIVLLATVGNRANVATICRKIQDSLSRPIRIDSHDLRITASMGAAVYPDDTGSVEGLLRHADTAMYAVKKHMKNGYNFFTSDMESVIRHRLDLDKGLRHALDMDEFRLEYQPIVHLADGRLTGVEALIRWQHPTRGLLAPMQFIPYAEENGMIVAIGEWVLQKACQQLKSWQNQGFSVFQVALNVSGRQFHEHDFLLKLASTLEFSGIDPHCIELELTETILMEQVEQTITTLEQVRALGIELAIDDFGTGYSSLSYLKRFGLDRLKIDQSFVRDITTDRNDAPIVSAIIAMAKSLNLSVTAEGVENEAQLAFLKAEGCTDAQGFHLGRPMPAAEFETWLRTMPQDVTTSQPSLAAPRSDA